MKIQTNIKFLIILFTLGFLFSCGTADLRTEYLKKTKNEQAESGKANLLLKEIQNSYGGLLIWRGKKNIQITFRDEWPGFVMRNFGMPWFKSGQKVRLTWATGTDNSRLVFLEDPEKNLEWGLQNWVTYTQKPGENIKFEEDSDIKFFLATIQFFMEAVFRLTQTDKYAYAGEKEYNGKTYDLVLVSWKDIKPQKDIDQYLLWINRETKRVDLIQYTVREFAGFIQGTALYEDFRDVEGLILPFKITLVDDPINKEITHEMKIESIEYKSELPQEYLLPAPNRKSPKF